MSPDAPIPGEAPEDLEKVVASVRSGTDSLTVPTDLLDDRPAASRTDQRPIAFRIREMAIAQRIKLALRGGKEARILLLRDSVAMVKRMVLQNPRISEDEILSVCQDRNADKDVLREIAENREWVLNYGIRLALAENPRTALVHAVRFLNTLQERDLRNVARSRNVSSTVSSQARRILYQREMRRKGGH